MLKYREKGTDVRYLNGHYYLYSVTSKYDPSVKRSRKVTLAYLGRITPEGLVRPKAARMMDELQYITNREYGASSFILSECSDVIELLKKHFPDEWKEIAVCAIIRFFHSSPMKNMQLHYVSSHLSDALPDARMSPESVSNLLHYTGLRRQRIVDFMSNFVQGEQCVIDLTHVFSRSENVIVLHPTRSVHIRRLCENQIPEVIGFYTVSSTVRITRVCKNVNIIAEIQLLQILLQTDT